MRRRARSLVRSLEPFLLRRVKEDVEKSLPPKEETVVEVSSSRYGDSIIMIWRRSSRWARHDMETG